MKFFSITRVIINGTHKTRRKDYKTFYVSSDVSFPFNMFLNKFFAEIRQHAIAKK